VFPPTGGSPAADRAVLIKASIDKGTGTKVLDTLFRTRIGKMGMRMGHPKGKGTMDRSKRGRTKVVGLLRPLELSKTSSVNGKALILLLQIAELYSLRVGIEGVEK
jgi:hypothetical protein